jgi:uncharacterized protein (AIM24 family)
MHFEIRYNPAHSLAIAHLGAGESVRAEASAMVTMSSGVTVSTSMNHKAGGGFMGALKRRHRPTGSDRPGAQALRQHGDPRAVRRG